MSHSVIKDGPANLSFSGGTNTISNFIAQNQLQYFPHKVSPFWPFRVIYLFSVIPQHFNVWLTAMHIKAYIRIITKDAHDSKQCRRCTRYSTTIQRQDHCIETRIDRTVTGNRIFQAHLKMQRKGPTHCTCRVFSLRIRTS